MKKLLIIMMLVLTACSQDVSEETYYDYIAPLTDAYGNMVLPLNTTIRLTMKDERLLEETIEELSDIIYEYHMLFDAYHDYEYVTNLKTINDSYGTGQEVAINVELYNLIKEAIEYTKLSEGKFNLTIGSLYNVYEPLFSNIPVVLEDPDISKAKACVVNYEDIDEVIVLGEGQTIRFNEYDGCEEKVQISLGAISKGYITDKAIEYLDSLDIYYLLDVGSSNVYGHSDDNFTVGIRSMYDMNDYLFPVSLPPNTALSTSGDTNNYYLVENEDGTTTIRSHIIDAELGYSPNYYRNVTVITESNLSADLMSTVLFLCEDEEAINKYLKIFSDYFDEDIEYSLIEEISDKELKLISSKGFDEYIMEDYISSYIIEKEVVE